MSNQLDEKISQMSPDKQALWKLRHSAEHVLMMAMEKLYPGKFLMAMGPATDEGFYFDFEPNRDFKFTEEKFTQVENEMGRLINLDLPITKANLAETEARNLFKNNPYKQEWIDETVKRGEDLAVFWLGKPGEPDSFIDLCSGPHLASTGQIKAVKLLSMAGAYWRGDENNKMLTRIYGTAFPTKEELDKYLWQIEEAKKRDHRKLGKELDLFVFSNLVGPGLPLFTPKGTIIRRELENFVRGLQEAHGYQTVLIPHLTKTGLYETSGHWAKYGENMFHVFSHDKEEFALKPMNCPHHTQIFASKPRSYREMPQRYAEVTAVYRNEKVGELLGLSRVYMLTQDDAHVFCTEEQAINECLIVHDIIKNFYKVFGFDISMKVRMSLRDPKQPEKYLGDDKLWEKSESMMREVAKQAGLDVYDGIGEAAFYAPKLDFMAHDALGREWQLATIQLDFNFPERFDLRYTDKDGNQKRPVMIHRAILGSVERFMSILIEHFAGAFPTWLSPVQVAILPISDKTMDHAKEIESKLKNENIRVELKEEAESLSKKIRKTEAEKIPYMLIIGEKEVVSQTVSVRRRGEHDLGQMTFADFFAKIKAEIDQKLITSLG